MAEQAAVTVHLADLPEVRELVEAQEVEIDRLRRALGRPLSSEPTYTVTWAREDGDEQTCKGLTLGQAFARLRGAMRASGPITVLAVVREIVRCSHCYGPIAAHTDGERAFCAAAIEAEP